MPTIVEALTWGIENQRAGRRGEAEAIYREILRHQPGNADALHLLGLVAHEGGRHERALDLISQALALAPALAPFHNSLGSVLHALGRWEEARAAFERALALDPGFAQAHVNFGNLLQDLGSPGDAVLHYQEALGRMPGAPEVHNNLGNAHLALGHPEQAVGCFQTALGLRPDYGEALVNLGGALQRLKRLEEAEACCRQAIGRQAGLPEAYANLAAILVDREQWAEAEASCREALRLRPDFAEAWCNLGNLWNLRKGYAEGERCCRRALGSRPRHPESWNNLGNALKQQDRLEEAIACYREALGLRPDYANAYANQGSAWYHLGNFGAAMECYDAALRIDPSHPEARLNRGLLLLLRGEMEEGWREYEWRWELREFPRRRFEQPLWRGEPPAGRTILVTAEQGLGDTIQFVRYLPVLRERGARVVLECQAALASLLRDLAGTDAQIACGAPLPAFDLHIPLLSLPRLLGGLPARVPYVPADPERVDAWRGRLEAEHRFRVGVVWAGNPDHPGDRRRSIPMESLRALAEVPGVALFSLQKGASPPSWMPQLVEPAHEVADTAALLLHLDLLISVDTMMAHLAGAMGRPVWVLLPLVPDWRWLLDREDSPWYPSARLFRQESPGAWEPVLERVRCALACAAAAMPPACHPPPGRLAAPGGPAQNLLEVADMPTDGESISAVPGLKPGISTIGY